VTSAKIANNAVTSNKIADGTVGYGDMSQAFIAVDSKIDCDCGGTGWDPDGSSTVEYIFDGRITPSSVVVISGDLPGNLVCWTEDPNSGFIIAKCNVFIPENLGINFAILNPQ
jgi:hypothetical protein